MDTNIVSIAHWTENKIRMPKAGASFKDALDKVKPVFATWMQADNVFEKNTRTLAAAIRHAFDLYKAESKTGTRVDFARFFDTGIPAGAVSRDLKANATYNRLNYLLDKHGRTSGESNRAERVPVTERRKKVHADWLQFRRRYAKKPIALPEVEALMQRVLTELWPEEAVKEVLAA